MSIMSTNKWEPFGVNCEVNTDALPIIDVKFVQKNGISLFLILSSLVWTLNSNENLSPNT